MSDSTRLGVMGGTFDPIHIGHLIAASEAVHALALDRVLFVPTGMPWQKPGRSDPEDRFLMTCLGTEGHSAFGVSRIELDRRGPTYTVDTMRQLKTFYKENVELFFLAGVDAVLGLSSWERVGDLAALTTVVALTRPGFDLESLQPQPDWPPIETLDIPAVHISSTELRARVAEGRPIDFLVPAPVAEYVRSRGLYVGMSADA